MSPNNVNLHSYQGHRSPLRLPRSPRRAVLLLPPARAPRRPHSAAVPPPPHRSHRGRRVHPVLADGSHQRAHAQHHRLEARRIDPPRPPHRREKCPPRVKFNPRARPSKKSPSTPLPRQMWGQPPSAVQAAQKYRAAAPSPLPGRPPPSHPTTSKIKVPGKRCPSVASLDKWKLGSQPAQAARASIAGSEAAKECSPQPARSEAERVASRG